MGIILCDRSRPTTNISLAFVGHWGCLGEHSADADVNDITYLLHLGQLQGLLTGFFTEFVGGNKVFS